jgi:hypothetical protein
MILKLENLSYAAAVPVSSDDLWMNALIDPPAEMGQKRRTKQGGLLRNYHTRPVAFSFYFVTY